MLCRRAVQAITALTGRDIEISEVEMSVTSFKDGLRFPRGWMRVSCGERTKMCYLYIGVLCSTACNQGLARHTSPGSKGYLSKS